MLVRVVGTSVVAVGMCVCCGVVGAVAFACIFGFILVASCVIVAKVRGGSLLAFTRAAAFTVASVRSLAPPLLLVIAVAVVLGCARAAAFTVASARALAPPLLLVIAVAVVLGCEVALASSLLLLAGSLVPAC